MFTVTYLRRELRHRKKQAVFTALGLAVAIGTVVSVSAASSGAAKAQTSVLKGLYGVGTDISVTVPWSKDTAGPGQKLAPRTPRSISTSWTARPWDCWTPRRSRRSRPRREWRRRPAR
ncbi:hypothetical protein ACFQ9X_43355 [Catenulispora yoronensis]